jgi:hypothetical protein
MERDSSLKAVFEIDVQVNIPAGGYGLNAVRRFLITFGRRRHIEAVPLAILFGRAVPGSGRVRQDGGASSSAQ